MATPSDPTVTPPAAPGSATLLRALGLGTAVAVVVGNVIGSGIFLKPGKIAADGGDFTLIIVAWVVGGLLCLLGALCFAELATAMPQAGGLYVYLREAYGRFAAFLFGWNELLFSRPGSIGALSVAFAGKLALAVGFIAGTWTQVLLAVSAIALMAWINCMGVIWGGRMQSATTLIKAAGLGLIAAAPFVVYAWNGSAVDPVNYRSHLTTTTAAPADGAATANRAAAPPGDYAHPADQSLPTRFGIILLAIMWAYNGWHGITPVAEEVRNPARNIPLALFGGIGILMLLYCSANVAYHGVLSMDQMAQADQHAAEVMIAQIMPSIGATIVTSIIICSLFGAINCNLLISPRVAFAMGRDGLFFRQLGRVHVSFRTPSVAIVVQALMAVALVAASGVVTTYVSDYTRAKITKAVENEDASLRQRVAAALEGKDTNLRGEVEQALQAESPEDQQRVLEAIEDAHAAIGSEWQRKLIETLQSTSVFDLLTNFVIFAASIFYMLCVLAVVILRFKHPEWKRPYRTWGYPLVPLLFLAFYGWFLVEWFGSRPAESIAGLALIGLGVPVHFAWQWRARRRAAAAGASR